MNTSYRRVTKAAAFVLLLATLASCGLPRVGPTKTEIFKSTEDESLDTYVVAVNAYVNRAIPAPPSHYFPASFIDAHPLTPDVIRPGDTLAFTIYENVDDGLFSQGGASAASISTIQVDDTGFIFIPYAGRIQAAGNTPERIRQIVTDKLGKETPEPQVVVQRSVGDGGTVSVVGNGIGAQGTYPLRRSNLRLMGLLANAGGISGEPDAVRVIVIRGQHRGEMWYEDIYSTPKFDIALRPGDRIIVENDTREFTALGATGSQALVPFEARTLTALEALARVGGLRETAGDPTGIFVIRNETPEIANTVMGRTDFVTDQQVIYLLNLTEPNGLFTARNFHIRDGDTVYVTEAPYAQWRKVLGAVVGTVAAVATIDAVAN